MDESNEGMLFCHWCGAEVVWDTSDLIKFTQLKEAVEQAIDIGRVEPIPRCRLIITSTYREFQSWCVEHQIKRSDKTVKWVKSHYDLDGYGQEDKIILGCSPYRFELTHGVGSLTDIYFKAKSLGIQNAENIPCR